MTINRGLSDTSGAACQDCVVAVLAPPGVAPQLEAEELRALSVLADAGMISPAHRTIAPSAPRRASKTPGIPRNWVFPTTRAS